MSTLLVQSHRRPLPYACLGDCVQSVRNWADAAGWQYRWTGDEIFDLLDPELRSRCSRQVVIASDLARLRLLRGALDEGYDTVVWCDADLLVFAPGALILPETSYALGREVWVQARGNGLRAYRKVHNAVMMFRRGNPFLDFYIHAAEHMVRAHRGDMVPQFIGPKFLTAIHNIIQCPVIETAAMLSPDALRDLLAGGGPALELLREQSPAPPAAFNLCASLLGSAELAETEVEKVMTLLLERGSAW